MIKHKITIPIYGGKLVVVKCKNLKAINKKYNTEADNTVQACAFRLISKKGKRRYFMVFHKNTSNAILVHEAVHIVNMIFHDICHKPDENNDEPQAYLTEWVFEQAEQFLMRKI